MGSALSSQRESQRISEPAELTADGLPEQISQSIAVLAETAGEWHAMPDEERAAVVRECRARLATLPMDWVADNMRCLGLDPSQRDAYNTAGFDPFLFVATAAARMDKLADGLEGKLSATVERQLPEEGPCVYQMGMLGSGAPGVELELWAAAEGGEPEPSSADAAGVGVVLGAGNQNFLTLVDVLELAAVHKKAVLLKHHPLRHFMTAPFQHILDPLAEAGAFAQCTDAQLGRAHAALLTHPAVTHVHMTGSGATHDRVRAALAETGRTDSVLFTSELGCVTPWIVCPGTANEGKWEDAQIEAHAQMLAAAVKSSCSMNCLSPKLLVLPDEAVWPQRPEFLAALRAQLASMPQPPPYYPGAHQRYAAFQNEYPEAETIEAPPSQPEGLESAVHESLGQDISPLHTLLVDAGVLGDKAANTYAIQTEAFAPVLAVATAACEGPVDFPRAAARAVNEHVFGTLSCNVIWPDERSAALDEMVRLLEYGCVSVNCWAALSYSNALGVWGGAPGSYQPAAPMSGSGFVGNAARVPSVQKAVVLSAFENKSVVMGKPMPLIVAESLTALVGGDRLAPLKIMGTLLRRGFGLLPPSLPA